MIVQAKNVSIIYKKALKKSAIIALDDFSITINEGDIYGILGPNGAGKTTAMHAMLGLLRCDKGEIYILGKRPSPGSEIFNEISYLPEEPVYHNYLTIKEALLYYSQLYNNSRNSKAIQEYIEYFDLKGFENLKLEKCSKGMKQKVGLIQCLLSKKKILFLDEPTRGLDPITAKKFRDLLLGLNREGSTIIINSHLLSEVESLCNRVVILNKGKVIKEDEINNLIRFDTEKYQVEFSRTNTLPNYIDIKIMTESTIKGFIPTSKIQDFIIFLKETGSTLYEISLRKRSLEDYIFELIEKK